MDTHSISTHRPQLRRSRLWSALGGTLLAVLVLAGATACGGGDQPASGEPVAGATEVAVVDNAFEPAAIAVPAGSTVTWRWRGGNDHNVVGNGFESPVQDGGEFAWTFAAPGTYAYRCTLHGGMRGEVVVGSEAAS